MSEQMAPVTDTLAKALNTTFTVLGIIDTRGASNDKDHYAETVQQLEDLTVAVLSATSSLPLINVRPAGARFDIGAGTNLAEQVSDSVAYLRGEASALLARNSFSQFERKHADKAVGHLRGLYGLLLSAVTYQARADLNRIADKGPDGLIMAAEQLANLVPVKKL